MWYWKSWMKLDLSKSKIYHYNSEFKDEFYNKDWEYHIRVLQMNHLGTVSLKQ